MDTVVITGSSRGLGFTLANKFNSAGWNVVGTGRSSRPDNLDSNIQYSQFDASDAKACELFWKSLPSEQLDGTVCLINNAGGYLGGSLLETSPEDFEKQMRTNYFPAVYMTRNLISNLPKAKVFNIISASALAPGSTDGAYGSSKAATMHFFKSLQKEFKSDKYQITNLYPNNIATSGPNPDAINPDDIADFILNLAVSKSSYYLPNVTLHSR